MLGDEVVKKFYRSSDIREADNIATGQFGIPGFALMENAGRGAAEVIVQKYPEAENILILCGPGNNGGDGFVVARHLVLAGRMPIIIATIGVSEYKNDAEIAATAFDNMITSSATAFLKSKVRVIYSKNLKDDELSALFRTSDLTIDALLGTGSNGILRGEVRRLTELCKEAAKVVSLDIPSGVNPDAGEVEDIAVNAEMTITFLAEKTGLAVSPGSLHSGEVVVCNIGIPPELVLNAHELTGYEKSDIQSLMPPIPKNAHKGTRGALMVVGGSNSFRGAPFLAAMGALRAGCGLVFLAIPDFMVNSAAALLPEAIFVPLKSKNGAIDFDGFEQSVSPWLDKSSALVCGPGIGLSDGARKVTEWLCSAWDKPLLLDADALRHAADIKKAGEFNRNPKLTVFTPHEGEAAHMLNTNAKRVSGERLFSCEELANIYGVALLKGFHTLICDSAEKRIILEGGPQLAIPGSGDVLSGAIGAYLASGMTPINAATLGALMHSRAGDRYEGTDGLLASELARDIGIN